MWSLGDKIASSIVAQTAGIPTMPWSGTDLRLNYDKGDLQKGKLITVPQNVYNEATVSQIEDGIKVVIVILLFLSITTTFFITNFLTVCVRLWQKSVFP